MTFGFSGRFIDFFTEIFKIIISIEECGQTQASMEKKNIYATYYLLLIGLGLWEDKNSTATVARSMGPMLVLYSLPLKSYVTW